MTRKPISQLKMTKVLLIAHDFPPMRTSGIYRPSGMCKHLRQFGWEPTVLTVESRPEDLQDPLLLKRIPQDLRVVRTPSLKISGWENRTAAAVRAVGGLKPKTKSGLRTTIDHLVRRSAEFARSCLYFPDEYVGWIPFGFYKALQLVMEGRFDLIYTTSPPRAAAVIGLLLKMLTGMPWVAEFRDPWYPSPRPLRRRFERMLLSRILHSADAVVTTSKGLAAELQQSFSLQAKTVAAINNGYEESDFLPADRRNGDLLAPGFFHFSHFGTIYPNCSGRFFDALRELLRESPELKSQVRVNVVGFPDEKVRREILSEDLNTVAQVRGFVDHETAIAAMRSSDCLLLFWGNRDFSRLAVAGKTYEYLRVGRPILAVTYEGDIAQLVRNGQAGWVADPDDVQAIKRVLREAISSRPKGGNPSPIRREFVEQFRYDRLAEKLAGVFDSVIRHGS